MKRSTLLLIAGAAVVLVMVIVFGIAARSVSTRSYGPISVVCAVEAEGEGTFFHEGTGESLGDMALSPGQSVDIPLSDVSRLDTTGSWDVTISMGDAPSARLTAPDEGRFYIKVIEKGGKLSADIRKSRSSSSWSGKSARLDLTVKGLSKLDFVGFANVELKDFRGDELGIDFEGAGKLRGSGEVSSLDLEANGANECDLGALKVLSAKVDGNGMAKIVLLAPGGSVRGSIAGLVKLVVNGGPATVNVSAEGLSKVTQN